MLATPTTAVMCPAYVTPRVRELPRRLEPVTRDTFGELGIGRGLAAARGGIAERHPVVRAAAVVEDRRGWMAGVQ